MDKNEFFRKATLRICGNLEIEEAMHTLLQFLKEFMPVTKIYLQHCEHDYHAMRSVAYAFSALGAVCIIQGVDKYGPSISDFRLPISCFRGHYTRRF